MSAWITSTHRVQAELRGSRTTFRVTLGFAEAYQPPISPTWHRGRLGPQQPRDRRQGRRLSPLSRYQIAMLIAVALQEERIGRLRFHPDPFGYGCPEPRAGSLAPAARQWRSLPSADCASVQASIALRSRSAETEKLSDYRDT